MGTTRTRNSRRFKRQKFWYADWGFYFSRDYVSGNFAGTHNVVYGVGAFNEVSIVAMLKAGLDGGSYGAAAAFVQVSVCTNFRRFFSRDFRFRWLNFNGIGIGVPAIFSAWELKRL